LLVLVEDCTSSTDFDGDEAVGMESTSEGSVVAVSFATLTFFFGADIDLEIESKIDCSNFIFSKHVS
jgi:hypothetical protein